MRRTLVLIAAILAACSEPVQAPEFQPAAGRDACRGGDGYAATFEGRRTFLWRSDWLKAIKGKLPGGRPAAFARLIRRAEDALRREPYDVVQKAIVPPSGDRHDYYSQGTYWWPDPDKPDGLPYIRRDGEINPDVNSDKFDYAKLNSMSGDVTALSLAYYLTDNHLYAAHAAKMLRAWFLDPATAMNPNLKFAQGVPGRSEGRSTGIIETIALIPVVESIGLLQTSASLSVEEVSQLKAWFGQYVDWLRNSDAGKEEAGSPNNHAVAYDAQVIGFALFTGQTDIARQVASQFPERRISRQISADGSMPEELSRARTFHYAMFSMGLMTDVASLSECAGVDLWRFKKPDGGGLRAAFDFVAVYAGREQAWPYPEAGDEIEWHRYRVEFHDLLMRAAWAFDDPSFSAKAASHRALVEAGDGNIVVPDFDR